MTDVALHEMLRFAICLTLRCMKSGLPQFACTFGLLLVRATEPRAVSFDGNDGRMGSRTLPPGCQRRV
jgi:hypothetical protein